MRALLEESESGLDYQAPRQSTYQAFQCLEVQLLFASGAQKHDRSLK